jgi:pimeloyl-ACP methyl ester carboxylesterase
MIAPISRAIRVLRSTIRAVSTEQLEPRSAPDAAEAEPAGAEGRAPEPDLGPRAVTYPYKRIVRPEPTPDEGPDPYGVEGEPERGPAWLRIDWREHLHRIEIDGTTVNYAEIGSGRPIVFVHGLGGCWQNWLENLPHFAERGYRAIALDLPGFGASPMPDWEISMPAYGRLVDGFARELGLEAAAVVGNSMGGFIAAEVATNGPDWTDHLALVSAAGISHATMRREPALVTARMLAVTAPLVLRFNELGLRRPGVRQAAFRGVMRHPLKMRRELLYEFFVPAMGSPGFGDAMVSLTGYDFLDRLAEIDDPTLIVWGRDDLVVPASDSDGYEGRIADAELHVFEDCGHVPMAERPVRFNRLLGEFIERPR